MELYTIEGFKINSLKHYGIKGQKWGIRRYQKENGTYTVEGRRRYKTDQKKADILTAEARISSRAVDLAKKKTRESEFLTKHFSNKTFKKRYEINKRVLRTLDLRNKQNMNEIYEHTKHLKDVYGKDNVKEIRTNKKGIVLDKVKDKDKSNAASFISNVGMYYLSSNIIKKTLGEPIKSISSKLVSTYSISKKAVDEISSTSMLTVPVTAGLFSTAAALATRKMLVSLSNKINGGVTEKKQVEKEYTDEYNKEKKLLKVGEKK